MANGVVSVHVGIYGMGGGGIYAIMLQSSGFSVAHCSNLLFLEIWLGWGIAVISNSLPKCLKDHVYSVHLYHTYPFYLNTYM